MAVAPPHPAIAGPGLASDSGPAGPAVAANLAAPAAQSVGCRPSRCAAGVRPEAMRMPGLGFGRLAASSRA